MRGGLTWLAARCARGLPLGLALMLAVAGAPGCGGDSASAPTVAEPPVTRALTPAEQARAAARAARREQIRVARTFVPNPWREPGPTAPHPHGEPRRLMVHDVRRGSGPALTGRERVYADFVKTYWLSGRKFLVSWGWLRTAWMELPSEAAGIRRGMIGMRPGGRRTIAIPRAIADVHPPDGSAGFVAARMDVVLRKIITE